MFNNLLERPEAPDTGSIMATSENPNICVIQIFQSTHLQLVKSIFEKSESLDL